MGLTICSYGTKNYLYAWPQVLRRISAAIQHLDGGDFVFSTDETKEGKAAGALIERELPKGWTVHLVANKIEDDTTKSYGIEAQIRIAVLQGSAFSLARKLKSDKVWSVESDVLVSPSSLKACEWALDCPDGYYDIAMSTYPNSGFLGGRGNYQNAISEDFLPKERILPPRLKLVFEECEKRLSGKMYPLLGSWKEIPEGEKIIRDTKAEEPIISKEYKRRERLHKKIRNCPTSGNIFKLNGEFGWRQRGWLEHAYPAIGRGAIVPTDWVGLGCTLLSKRALDLATFEGYNGQGTQDLYLCRSRWRPAGLRMAVLPHEVCDHVKPKLKDGKKVPGEYVHYHAYHEPEGECVGHLRVQELPWIPV